MSLERYLDELADSGQAPEERELVQFSGLTQGEVQVLQRAWGRLSAEQRRQIVSRLVELAGASVQMDFTEVFRLCLQDPDEVVREQAVTGLWESEERTLVQPLIDLLKQDPSPHVRAAAAVGLGKFAALAEEGKILPRDGVRIREALLEAIRQPGEPEEVRCHALEGVAFFNNLPEVRELLQKFYESPRLPMRRSAVAGMGHHGDPAWLPIVLRELSSDDVTMRVRAATSCGYIGEEAAVPHLARVLRDDDFQVQISAVKALGNIGGRPAKRVLHECLRSGDEALQSAVEEALRLLELEEDPLGTRFDY